GIDAETVGDGPTALAADADAAAVEVDGTAHPVHESGLAVVADVECLVDPGIAAASTQPKCAVLAELDILPQLDVEELILQAVVAEGGVHGVDDAGMRQGRMEGAAGIVADAAHRGAVKVGVIGSHGPAILTELPATAGANAAVRFGVHRLDRTG